MRIITTLTTLAVVSALEECNYALELLVLQDVTSSFETYAEVWRNAMASLDESLRQEYGDYKIGLSAFADKPTPYRGLGNYGGFQVYGADYCYKQVVPIGDQKIFLQGLNNLAFRSGGNLPEGQHEGMLYAALDPAAGWSDPEVTHAADGRPLVRLMLMVTDESPNEPPAAAAGINLWNAPRIYPNGYDEPSTGGFGSHNPTSESVQGLYAYNSWTYAAEWKEMADLFAIKDKHDAAGGAALTATQSKRLDELVALLGPEQFPALKYTTHPGDFSTAEDCDVTEYPTFNQTFHVLNERKIFPIFLLTNPSKAAYYEWFDAWYPMEYIIKTIGDNGLDKAIIEAVKGLASKICLEVTTTTTTTTTSKGSGDKGEGDGDNEEGDGDKEGGNGHPEGNGGESTTESVVVVAVPPAAEAGTPIGTIAGATAGAAAGLAALGAVLYKTVGAAWFGGSPDTPDAADQVEVPENQVEREAMEQVTMDMFN